MTAYVVVDIDVKDPEAYKQYVALAPASVEPTAAGILHAQVEPRNWKGTGCPGGW